MKPSLLIKKSLFVSAFVLAQANSAFALTPEAVTPYLTDMSQLRMELANIKTPQQAQAYLPTLQAKMPGFQMKHKMLVDAIPAFETAKQHGSVPAPMITAATSVNNFNAAVVPDLEMQMGRVEKLNPALKAHFDVVRPMHK